MKCPACRRTLSPLTVDDVIVEACQDGCAGIWFNQGDLNTLTDPAKAVGRLLFSIARDSAIRVDLTQRRRCPRCPSSVLMRHFSSAKRVVVVDECPICGGVWLDAGELEQIRFEYPDEGARRQAAQMRFEEALIDDRMALSGRRLEEQAPYDVTRSRVASAVLTVVYVAVASKSGAVVAVKMLRFCLLPLACIWFPDALGSLARGRIARTSPRSFVRFLGWTVLLLPVIMTIIVTLGLGRWPFGE